jgi:hypothetical protein
MLVHQVDQPTNVLTRPTKRRGTPARRIALGLAVACVIGGVAAPAEAATRWSKVAKTPDGTRILVNSYVVVPLPEPGQYTYPAKITHAALEVDGKRVGYSLSTDRVDCMNNRTATGPTVFYTKRSVVIGRYPDDPQWRPIVPGSTADSVRKFICDTVIRDAPWR